MNKISRSQIKEMREFLQSVPKYASYNELAKYLSKKYTKDKTSRLLAYAITHDFERFCTD